MPNDSYIDYEQINRRSVNFSLVTCSFFGEKKHDSLVLKKVKYNFR